MSSFKSRMLSSAVFPVAVVAGFSIVDLISPTGSMTRPAMAANPCAARNPCAAKRGCNPCAAKRGCNPCAAKNPCNPCAAKSACNPCAAKNPCNPCAAKNACNPCAAKNPCAASNPCNPCAASAGSGSECVVPRLKSAAKNPCNPCAAKNPCNPCAAKSACNPCAAKNPCNPCAAKNPCNPCAAKSACNPCAAKNPCNPCAAKNPCNPCAAKNPCNPCAASNPCNPCNPCAASDPVELSDAEAAAAYDCVIADLKAAYGKSGLPAAKNYTNWRRYSRVAYTSGTHGNRLVQNYANDAGRSYGAFEKSGVMPSGAVLAKDSFSVSANGKIGVGPFFLMEKMPKGFKKASGDWKYSMVLPNGSVLGVTNGKNSKSMNFCYECHMAVAEEQDSMMFMPDEYRAK
jgi:hypothetical protein